MAAKPIDSPLDISSAEKDWEEGQDNERKDENSLSLERKDSLKAKTLQKRGHLRLKEDGQTTYKRTSSSAIVAAIQLGIGYSVGRLTAKQERDILMQDFNFVEKVWFPGSGSRETPSHRFVDFKFKSYAPSAFRYFRDLFGMLPTDFLMALSNEELREISNPGASGSMFFLSADDNFIIKTVQHKEATFLQQLLPGYYMNLHQNPRTLLPKFFGLYCYQSQNRNIRLAVMNNILPTTFRCHQLYDLKGSTFKRKASKKELTKKTPTKKDLDFRNDYPEGITLDTETYEAVVKTIRRDCRVLESFKIMDYSLLLGIHNMDQALREKNDASTPDDTQEEENPERVARRAEFTAALEAIQIDKVEGRPLGGIPAKSPKGDRLILFLGIIDILQSYRLAKKLEHGWKSFVHDGDSVSVHNPSFYARRFVDFFVKDVFKVVPSGKGLSKRRSVQRQNQGSASTVTGARVRSITGGSFSEPVTPRSKEGKVKTSLVKFAEPTFIDDGPPKDEMLPPPYDLEASLTSQNIAAETEVSVFESPKARSDAKEAEPAENKHEVTAKMESEHEAASTIENEHEVTIESEHEVSVVKESEHEVSVVKESEHEVTAIKSEHEVSAVKESKHEAASTNESEPEVTIESEHEVTATIKSEHEKNEVSAVNESEHEVTVTMDSKHGEPGELSGEVDDNLVKETLPSERQGESSSVLSTSTHQTLDISSGESSVHENSGNPQEDPTEMNDVSLTSESSYYVIDVKTPENDSLTNNTVTTTTTKTITKTVTVIANGDEHVMTSGGSDKITEVGEGHVTQIVKTTHFVDEADEVLAGNSKPTVRLTDVNLEVDNDKNDNLERNKTCDNKLLDCKEVTAL